MAGLNNSTKKGLWKRFLEHFFQNSSEDDECKEQLARGINVDKYKQELRNNGINGVKNLLSTDLNIWTEIEINIAVTGASGSGKSSFVNSIRGLKARDVNAAKVGVFDSTMTPSLYHHPENKSFVVWDLPGVGTPSFPKEQYLKEIGFEKYDFFIIVSKSRFTETDLWLAREIQNLNKSLLFVHSNIDKDIDDNREDDPDNHMEEKVIQEIKTKTERELKDNGVDNPKVFLINNRKTEKFDFGLLNNEMLSSIDSLKKESLVLTLSAVTKEFIAEKKLFLQNRIGRVAHYIALHAEMDDQKRIFQRELRLYQQQLNIDNAPSSDNTDILTLSNDDIQEFHYSPFGENSQEGMGVKMPADFMKRIRLFDREFIDIFPWLIKNKIVFAVCSMALKHNLEILYKKSIDFYDNPKTNSWTATNSSTDL